MKRHITGADGKVRIYEYAERTAESERDQYILDSPLSTRLLAAELGISSATVSRIRRGVDRGSRAKRVVYFIAGAGLMKIGKTSNIASRFAGFRCGSPVPLTLLMTHPGYTELESALHGHFSGRHSHGEWFNVTLPEVEEFLAGWVEEHSSVPMAA